MSFSNLVIVLIATITFWIINFPPEAQAVNIVEGDRLFEIHCAGCHLNGGNIIRRGKNLKLKALERNKMDSLEAIVQIVTEGKANMSSYRDRLLPEEIQTVAAYVLTQAKQEWH